MNQRKIVLTMPYADEESIQKLFQGVEDVKLNFNTERSFIGNPIVDIIFDPDNIELVYDILKNVIDVTAAVITISNMSGDKKIYVNISLSKTKDILKQKKKSKKNNKRKIKKEK